MNEAGRMSLGGNNIKSAIGTAISDTAIRMRESKYSQLCRRTTDRLLF